VTAGAVRGARFKYKRMTTAARNLENCTLVKGEKLPTQIIQGHFSRHTHLDAFCLLQRLVALKEPGPAARHARAPVRVHRLGYRKGGRVNHSAGAGSWRSGRRVALAVEASGFRNAFEVGLRKARSKMSTSATESLTAQDHPAQRGGPRAGREQARAHGYTARLLQEYLPRVKA